MGFKIKITAKKKFATEQQRKDFNEIVAKYDKEYVTFAEMKKAAEELDRELMTRVYKGQQNSGKNIFNFGADTFSTFVPLIDNMIRLSNNRDEKAEWQGYLDELLNIYDKNEKTYRKNALFEMDFTRNDHIATTCTEQSGKDLLPILEKISKKAKEKLKAYEKDEHDLDPDKGYTKKQIEARYYREMVDKVDYMIKGSFADVEYSQDIDHDTSVLDIATLPTTLHNLKANDPDPVNTIEKQEEVSNVFPYFHIPSLGAQALSKKQDYQIKLDGGNLSEQEDIAHREFMMRNIAKVQRGITKLQYNTADPEMKEAFLGYIERSEIDIIGVRNAFGGIKTANDARLTMIPNGWAMNDVDAVGNVAAMVKHHQNNIQDSKEKWNKYRKDLQDYRNDQENGGVLGISEPKKPQVDEPTDEDITMAAKVQVELDKVVNAVPKNEAERTALLSNLATIVEPLPAAINNTSFKDYSVIVGTLKNRANTELSDKEKMFLGKPEKLEFLKGDEYKPKEYTAEDQKKDVEGFRIPKRVYKNYNKEAHKEMYRLQNFGTMPEFVRYMSGCLAPNAPEADKNAAKAFMASKMLGAEQGVDRFGRFIEGFTEELLKQQLAAKIEMGKEVDRWHDILMSSDNYALRSVRDNTNLMWDIAYDMALQHSEAAKKLKELNEVSDAWKNFAANEWGYTAINGIYDKKEKSALKNLQSGPYSDIPKEHIEQYLEETKSTEPRYTRTGFRPLPVFEADGPLFLTVPEEVRKNVEANNEKIHTQIEQEKAPKPYLSSAAGVTSTGTPVVSGGAVINAPENNGQVSGGAFFGTMQVEKEIKTSIESGSAGKYFYFNETNPGSGTYNMYPKLPEYGCDGPNGKEFKLRVNHNRFIKGLAQKFVNSDGTINYDRGLSFLREMTRRFGSDLSAVKDPDHPFERDPEKLKESALNWLCREFSIPMNERDDFKNFCQAAMDFDLQHHPNANDLHFPGAYTKAFDISNLQSLWEKNARNFREAELIGEKGHAVSPDIKRRREKEEGGTLFQDNYDMYFRAKDELIRFANIDPEKEMNIILPTECSGSEHFLNGYTKLANEAERRRGNNVPAEEEKNSYLVNFRQELHNQGVDFSNEERTLKWNYHKVPVVGSFNDKEGNKKYITIEAFAPDGLKVAEHPAVTDKPAIGIYSSEEDFKNYYMKESPFIDDAPGFKQLHNFRLEADENIFAGVGKNRVLDNTEKDDLVLNTRAEQMFNAAKAELENAGISYPGRIRAATQINNHLIERRNALSPEEKETFDILHKEYEDLLRQSREFETDFAIYDKIAADNAETVRLMDDTPQNRSTRDTLHAINTHVLQTKLDLKNRKEAVDTELAAMSEAMQAILERHEFNMDSIKNPARRTAFGNVLNRIGISEDAFESYAARNNKAHTEGVIDIQDEPQGISQSFRQKQLANMTREDVRFAEKHIDALLSMVYSDDKLFEMSGNNRDINKHIFIDGKNINDYITSMDNNPEEFTDGQKKALVLRELMNGHKVDMARPGENGTIDIIPVRGTSNVPEIKTNLEAAQASTANYNGSIHAEAMSMNSDIMISDLDDLPFFLTEAWRDIPIPAGDAAGLSEYEFNDTHDYFEKTVGKFIQPEQRELLKQAGMHPLSVFLIDGKPANEVFAEKYQNYPEKERDTMIEAEILHSLADSSLNVQIRPVIRTNEGNIVPGNTINNLGNIVVAGRTQGELSNSIHNNFRAAATEREKEGNLSEYTGYAGPGSRVRSYRTDFTDCQRTLGNLDNADNQRHNDEGYTNAKNSLSEFITEFQKYATPGANGTLPVMTAENKAALKQKAETARQNIDNYLQHIPNNSVGRRRADALRKPFENIQIIDRAAGLNRPETASGMTLASLTHYAVMLGENNELSSERKSDMEYYRNRRREQLNGVVAGKIAHDSDQFEFEIDSDNEEHQIEIDFGKEYDVDFGESAGISEDGLEEFSTGVENEETYKALKGKVGSRSVNVSAPVRYPNGEIFINANDTTIPRTVLNSADPELVRRFRDENMEQLRNAGRIYVDYLNQRVALLRQVNNVQKEYGQRSKNGQVPPVPEAPEVNGDRIILKNAVQDDYQSSGNGCYSVAFKNMLGTRGVNISQEEIRAFRQNVNAQEAGDLDTDFTDELNNDIGGTPFHKADLLMNVAPNTAMNDYTLMVPANAQPNEIQEVTALLKNKIRGALLDDRSPVGININGHFMTIVGIEGDHVICKDSLTRSRLPMYAEPNKNHYYRLSDLVDAASSKGNHRMSLVWLSDLHKTPDGKVAEFADHPEITVDNNGKVNVDEQIPNPNGQWWNGEARPDNDRLTLNFVHSITGVETKYQTTHMTKFPQNVNMAIMHQPYPQVAHPVAGNPQAGAVNQAPARDLNTLTTVDGGGMVNEVLVPEEYPGISPEVIMLAQMQLNYGQYVAPPRENTGLNSGANSTVRNILNPANGVTATTGAPTLNISPAVISANTAVAQNGLDEKTRRSHNKYQDLGKIMRHLEDTGAAWPGHANSILFSNFYNSLRKLHDLTKDYVNDELPMPDPETPEGRKIKAAEEQVAHWATQYAENRVKINYVQDMGEIRGDMALMAAHITMPDAGVSLMRSMDRKLKTDDGILPTTQKHVFDCMNRYKLGDESYRISKQIDEETKLYNSIDKRMTHSSFQVDDNLKRMIKHPEIVDEYKRMFDTKHRVRTDSKFYTRAKEALEEFQKSRDKIIDRISRDIPVSDSEHNIQVQEDFIDLYNKYQSCQLAIEEYLNRSVYNRENDASTIDMSTGAEDKRTDTGFVRTAAGEGLELEFMGQRRLTDPVAAALSNQHQTEIRAYRNLYGDYYGGARAGGDSNKHRSAADYTRARSREAAQRAVQDSLSAAQSAKTVAENKAKNGETLDISGYENPDVTLEKMLNHFDNLKTLEEKLTFYADVRVMQIETFGRSDMFQKLQDKMDARLFQDSDGVPDPNKLRDVFTTAQKLNMDWKLEAANEINSTGKQDARRGLKVARANALTLRFSGIGMSEATDNAYGMYDTYRLDEVKELYGPAVCDVLTKQARKDLEKMAKGFNQVLTEEEMERNLKTYTCTPEKIFLAVGKAEEDERFKTRKEFEEYDALGLNNTETGLTAAELENIDKKSYEEVKKTMPPEMFVDEKLITYLEGIGASLGTAYATNDDPLLGEATAEMLGLTDTLNNRIKEWNGGFAYYSMSDTAKKLKDMLMQKGSKLEPEWFAEGNKTRELISGAIRSLDPDVYKEYKRQEQVYMEALSKRKSLENYFASQNTTATDTFNRLKEAFLRRGSTVNDMAQIIENRYGHGREISLRLAKKVKEIFNEDIKQGKNPGDNAKTTSGLMKAAASKLKMDELSDYSISMKSGKLQISYLPKMSDKGLDSLSKSDLDNSMEMQHFFENTDRLDSLREMFETKKRHRILNGSSKTYNNCVNDLKEFTEARNRLIREFKALNGQEIPPDRVNDFQNHMNSMAEKYKKCVKSLNDFLVEETKGFDPLNKDIKDTDFARIAASKGLLDMFKEASPKMANRVLRYERKADLSIEAESKLTNYETLYHKVLGDIKKQGGSDRHRRAATEAKVQLNQQRTNK